MIGCVVIVVLKRRIVERLSHFTPARSGCKSGSESSAMFKTKRMRECACKYTTLPEPFRRDRIQYIEVRPPRFTGFPRLTKILVRFAEFLP